MEDLFLSAVPTVRWLVSKRNANGGWASTQDTVVALQALAAYASKAYSPQFDVTIDMTNGDDKHSFKVNPDNSLVNLPKQMRWNLSGAATIRRQEHGQAGDDRRERQGHRLRPGAIRLVHDQRAR